jgi:hypothetical protein
MNEETIKCPNCGLCGNCGRCNADKHEDEVKWSWSKFFIGKLSNKFIAWLVFTVIIFIAMFTQSSVMDVVVQRFVWIIYGAVTIIYMLSGAIDKAVGNMQIKANLSAGAKLNKTMTNR